MNVAGSINFFGLDVRGEELLSVRLLRAFTGFCRLQDITELYETWRLLTGYNGYFPLLLTNGHTLNPTGKRIGAFPPRHFFRTSPKYILD